MQIVNQVGKDLLLRSALLNKERAVSDCDG